MQKEGVSLLTSMRSFMWFDSSTQIEMLPKTIGSESLENFPKNVYDRVCLNKIACPGCTNCNSTITRIYRWYVPKSNTTEASRRRFCKIALYKISEKFQRDIFVLPYLTDLQASNLLVSILLKRKCLAKHVGLTFNSRGDYYYLQKKVFIFEYRCRDVNTEIFKWPF